MNDHRELKKLAEYATPGPWVAQHPNAGQRGSEVASGGGLNQVCADLGPTNALYIAAANPSTVLALLAENDANKELADAEQESYDAQRRILDAVKAELEQVKTDFDAAAALIEALRKDRTDWQAECLKLGFEYVRAPDDHYVLADVPEMARLLAQLLGVEVRDKENDSYGETVSELQEQVEAGNNAFHRAYEAEAECDRLKEEVEALRNPGAKKTDCGHGHVYPTVSGYMAKCGGPGLCAMCSRDAASKAMGMENQRVVPVMRECVKGYGHGGQWCGPGFDCWLDPRSKSEKNGHGKGCVCSVCTQ